VIRSIVRRPIFVALVCALLAVGAGVPAHSNEDVVSDSCKLHPTHVLNPGCITSTVSELRDPSITLPDLSPDVTEVFLSAEWFTFDQETQTFTYGPPVLYFDTLSMNLGNVAVDLQSDDATNTTNPPVSQCVSWTGPLCRERQTVGGFMVHPTHGHIHFEDFASYALRRLLPDGTPDYSEAGVVATSDKVSFCLIDSQSLNRPNSAPAPTYLSCTGLREGISPGWTDIYSSDLEGQSFNLGDLPDGRYALDISLNPTGNVLESVYTNNRVAVTVEFANLSSPTGENRSAQIVGRSWS
jgi:lysyl oxidase